MKKKSNLIREYSMKEYIKTWGVDDDFFIRRNIVKNSTLFNSKIEMRDGKCGLISNLGPLKKLFKKETFLPFEILFPIKKKIYINYCDGTNYSTLDTLNRLYSQKENINQIFNDYYNGEEFEDGEFDEDPYMEERDRKTWKSPYSPQDEWHYLRAYFNHDYQNENRQIFLLEEPLAYAKRNGRNKKNLKKYIIEMDIVFEREDLENMIGIRII